MSSGTKDYIQSTREGAKGESQPNKDKRAIDERCEPGWKHHQLESLKEGVTNTRRVAQDGDKNLNNLLAFDLFVLVTISISYMYYLHAFGEIECRYCVTFV